MRGRIGNMTLRRTVRVLGVTTVVTFLFPAFVTVAMISIVGIPLALAMMAAPTLFLVALGASAARRFAGRPTLAPAIAGAAVTLLLLAVGASVFNARLESTAADLAAGDHDDMVRPLRAKTLGLVRSGTFGWSKGTSRCDGLCQRLLLSRAVERVFLAETARNEVDWNPTLVAHSFRLEQREVCPQVIVSDSSGRSAIENEIVEAGSNGTLAVAAQQASPAAEMRIAIASGRCLVEEEAVLADADVVVLALNVRRGTHAFAAGLNPAANTVNAERIAVFERAPTGFSERYRWTGISMEKHPAILVPTLLGGSELRMEPGFARHGERRNSRTFSTNWDFAPDLGLFLRDEAGLDIGRAAAVDTLADRLAIVTAALDRQGPLARVEKRVIEDLFEELSPWKTGRAAPADAVQAAGRERLRRVAMRALADPRVPAPRRTHALVQATANAGGAENAALADVLFARLATTDPALREDDPSYLGWPLSYLAESIAMLPPQAVLPHREDLERLARDPAARVRGSRALVQLGAFGDDAVPILLSLVDEAAKAKAQAQPRHADRDAWERPFRAALAALCRTGSQAPAIARVLLARLRDGTLPAPRSNAELLVTVFVKTGADPEPLRPLLGVDNSPDDRRGFDRMVSRARSKPECGQ